jgi:hypothetical protein
MSKKPILFTSLIIISIVSFIFSVGLIIGYIGGRFFTKKIIDEKSRMKPLIFNIKSWQVHLHHWFVGVVAVLTSLILGFPDHLTAGYYGILGGLILQDIYWDRNLYQKHFYFNNKWYKVLARNKKK